MSGMSDVNNERQEPSNQLLSVPPKQSLSTLPVRKVSRQVDDILQELPAFGDTSCGIWCLRGRNLQRFANKKAYVFLYSTLGCVFSATYAYCSGTITTMEKRFKIPSRNTGIISIGTDLAELFGCIYCYYAGKGHRPRWIAFGIYLTILFCCLSMLPHFLYGPGEEALQLTKEYNSTIQLKPTNSGAEAWSGDRDEKFLCLPNANRTGDCTADTGNFAPQIILFVANFVGGIGSSLFSVLGVSYMDDNIKKSKTPMLLSFSYFLRLMGPAFGYSLASFTLKLYIVPNVTPTITPEDPRWLGAWWLGWMILAILLFLFGNIVGLFPKILPRAAARKLLELEREKPHSAEGTAVSSETEEQTHQEESQSLSSHQLKEHVEQKESEVLTSLTDMLHAFKRLLTNKTLMCNNVAAVFYFLGYTPYGMFMPKYIEIQYRQSASVASLVTGTGGLVFSALGILLAGLIISHFKPRARYLAAYNVIVGAVSVAGMISFVFFGCSDSDNQMAMSDISTTPISCSATCNCDYIEYNPVCSEDGRMFISACHAGCRTLQMEPDGTKTYTNCSCSGLNYSKARDSSDEIVTSNLLTIKNPEDRLADFGTAVPGPCPVDCEHQFYLFLIVVCLLRLFGSAGRAPNFLVTVRCVDEPDKTVAMALGMTIVGLFAFIPSPILFGYLLDATCIVWGKTREGTGNCWLYSSERMRYVLNFTASGFVFIGTLFDVGVWYYVKDLEIFDHDVELDALE